MNENYRQNSKKTESDIAAQIDRIGGKLIARAGELPQEDLELIPPRPDSKVRVLTDELDVGDNRIDYYKGLESEKRNTTKLLGTRVERLGKNIINVSKGDARGNRLTITARKNFPTRPLGAKLTTSEGQMRELDRRQIVHASAGILAKLRNEASKRKDLPKKRLKEQVDSEIDNLLGP